MNLYQYFPTKTYHSEVNEAEKDGDTVCQKEDRNCEDSVAEKKRQEM
jgi:hypothetical protein